MISDSLLKTMILLPREMVSVLDYQSRQELIKILWQSGLYALEEIGEIFGFTRQRVWQILNSFKTERQKLPQVKWLNTKEASRASKTNEHTLIAMIRSGKINAVRLRHFWQISPTFLRECQELLMVTCPVCYRRFRPQGLKKVFCSIECCKLSNKNRQKKAFNTPYTKKTCPEWAKPLFRLAKEKPKPKDLISAKEAAKIAQVTSSIIYTLVWRGLLNNYPGPKKKIFVPLEQVQLYCQIRPKK
jgi:hypothetical protein